MLDENAADPYQTDHQFSNNKAQTESIKSFLKSYQLVLFAAIARTEFKNNARALALSPGQRKAFFMAITPDQFIMYRDFKNSGIQIAESFPGGFPFKQQLEAAWDQNQFETISQLYDAVRDAAEKHKQANTRTSRQLEVKEPTGLERLINARKK